MFCQKYTLRLLSLVRLSSVFRVSKQGCSLSCATILVKLLSEPFMLRIFGRYVSSNLSFWIYYTITTFKQNPFIMIIVIYYVVLLHNMGGHLWKL